MSTKPTSFKWGERTYIMGILNVTPDSFSGDGVAAAKDTVAETDTLKKEDIIAKAVAQAKQFVTDGADIIDIGGESTRPGSTPISAEEELARVLPVVQAVRQAVDVVISIDSYRASVAEAALAAGANWLNDVWSLRMDPDMAKLAAQAGCPIVLMHNRSKPKNVAQEEKLGGRFIGVKYNDLITDIKRELQESIDIALKAGVQESQIIIDPGIGFGKTVEQSLQLLNQIDQFKVMGFPILLGPSRKSFIGYTLDLPPDQRVEGTAATVAIGIDRGADIVRVHDVKTIVRVARMTDAIVRQST
jgi:dihydropteroate synthase